MRSLHESDQLQDYLINNQLMVDPKLANFNVLPERRLYHCRNWSEATFTVMRESQGSRDLNPWAYWLQSWDVALKPSATADSHHCHWLVGWLQSSDVAEKPSDSHHWDKGTCSTSHKTTWLKLYSSLSWQQNVQWICTQRGRPRMPDVCLVFRKWVGGTAAAHLSTWGRNARLTLIQNWLQLW